MKITKVCIENYHIIRIVAANKFIRISISQ